MEREYGFTRDVRDNGIAGWRVRLRKNGSPVANKFFSDKAYGGPDMALEKAREYRDSIAAQNQIVTTKLANTELFMTRQKLKLTQADSANYLGVSQLTYFRWERNEFDCPQVIPALLEYLATSKTTIQIIPQEGLSGLRQRLDLNKTEMGALIGMRYDTYGRWEACKTKPDGWAMVFFSAINAGWKGPSK